MQKSVSPLFSEQDKTKGISLVLFQVDPTLMVSAVTISRYPSGRITAKRPSKSSIAHFDTHLYSRHIYFNNWQKPSTCHSSIPRSNNKIILELLSLGFRAWRSWIVIISARKRKFKGAILYKLLQNCLDIRQKYQAFLSGTLLEIVSKYD